MKKPRKRVRSTRQSANGSAKLLPALIPQPNGKGALLSGGQPGNKGGSGPVPSVLRDRLRGSAAERIQVLEEIADAKVTLNLATKCENCGHEVEGIPPAIEEALATIEALVPTVGDRRAAVDTLLKYGLGEPADTARISPQQAVQFSKVYEGWLYANLTKELADRAVTEIQATLKAEGL